MNEEPVMNRIALYIFTNKKDVTVADGSTLGEVLRQMNCTQFITIYNGTFTDAEELDNIFLKDGDVIELLLTMAGG